MEGVTPQIEQHLNAGATMKRKDIILNNFLGGLAWGFGTVVGATVVVAILIYALKAIGVFNFLQSLISNMPIK